MLLKGRGGYDVYAKVDSSAAIVQRWHDATNLGGHFTSDAFVTATKKLKPMVIVPSVTTVADVDV